MNKIMFLFTLISLCNSFIFAQDFPAIEGITFQALTPSYKSNHKIEHIKTLKVPNGYLLISREWGGSGNNATYTDFKVRSSEQNVISLFDENLVFQKSFITDNPSEKGYEDLQSYYLDGEELSLVWKRTEKESTSLLFEKINISSFTHITKKSPLCTLTSRYFNVSQSNNELFLVLEKDSESEGDKLLQFEVTDTVSFIQTEEILDDLEDHLGSDYPNLAEYQKAFKSLYHMDFSKDLMVFGRTVMNDQQQVTGYKAGIAMSKNGETASERKQFEFPQDFVLDGLDEKQLKQYNKAIKQGKEIGIADLKIRWFITTKDGGYFICSDVTKEHSDAHLNIWFEKNSVIITKLDEDGNLVWHKKYNKVFPENRMIHSTLYPDKEQYFYVSGNDYLEMIGTMRNPDEKKHSLTRIKINADGTTSEKVLYNFDKKNGEVIEEFIWDSVEFMEKERTLIGLCTYGKNINGFKHAIFKLKLD